LPQNPINNNSGGESQEKKRSVQGDPEKNPQKKGEKKPGGGRKPVKREFFI